MAWFAFLVTAFSAVGPAAASQLGPCNAGTDGNFHSGDQELPGITRGVQSTVDFYNESLCINTGSMGSSFSSSWIALISTSPAGDARNNIYQVGFIKCQTAGCPLNSVHVYAYGHESGPGGAAVLPAAHFLTTVSGNTAYKIDYVNQPGIGQTYALYVAGAMKNWRIASDLNTCWTGGPKGYFVSNEVGDRFDQSGGEVSPHQDWVSIKYKNSNGTWVAMNNTPGIGCSPPESLVSQRCTIDPTAHDGIDTWDTRAP